MHGSLNTSKSLITAELSTPLPTGDLVLKRTKSSRLGGESITTKKPCLIAETGLHQRWRPPTLPHCIAVPSAQAGLTSLFGMGRGGTPPQ